MSVTLTLTDHQRTCLLLALGLARASAETYELYAPKAAKPHWATYGDEATELLDLVTEAPRDVEVEVPHLPGCVAIIRYHRCDVDHAPHSHPHLCKCGHRW